jgi:hypothetical protein
MKMILNAKLDEALKDVYAPVPVGRVKIMFSSECGYVLLANVNSKTHDERTRKKY